MKMTAYRSIEEATRYRDELRQTLEQHPLTIGIVRELVEVNEFIKQYMGETHFHVSENYSRDYWIAETN
jgi:hypothetical protein